MRKSAEKVKQLFRKQPDLLVTDQSYQLPCLRYAPDMAEVIWEIKRAFEQGISPEASVRGSQATFFLKDSENQTIAIFKTENYIQEWAAYRLDHENFAGIPQTVLARLEHPIWGGPLTGSCQYFVPKTAAVVKTSSKEIEKFSASSVRRLASLDIRLLNEDRHTSNILMTEDRQSLIPIDHGYILPHDVSDVYFDWLNWSQARTPFNDAELSYIGLLDPERDRTLLIQEMGFEEKRVNYLFIATILLKMGALRKLSSADLGSIISRKRKLLQKEALHSRFELLVNKVKERNAFNWTIFSRIVYEEVERTLDEYEKTITKYSYPTAHS